MVEDLARCTIVEAGREGEIVTRTDPRSAWRLMASDSLATNARRSSARSTGGSETNQPKRHARLRETMEFPLQVRPPGLPGKP